MRCSTNFALCMHRIHTELWDLRRMSHAANLLTVLSTEGTTTALIELGRSQIGRS